MPPALIPLPGFDPEALHAEGAWPPRKWGNVPSLEMRQAWLPTPELGFLPARVWLAVTESHFVVLADLEDRDITTTACQHNDPLWKTGDVFEIFARHADRPEYYEFHIAPNGVTLDLCYPRLYASRAEGVERYMVEPHFNAHVRCESGRNRWRVAVEIPAARLCPREWLTRPAEWRFSFCRYDCGPGRAPIVASTSPHTQADFHRGEEWLPFSVPAFPSA
jgi:hypothetical protein